MFCSGNLKALDPKAQSFSNLESAFFPRFHQQHGELFTADTRCQIDASGAMPDGSKFNGPAELRKQLVRNPEQFVTVVAEKLLIYALGRGIEYYDASAVRSAVRAAATSDYKFATLVAGLAKSAPFQMRETSQPAASSGRPAAR